MFSHPVRTADSVGRAMPALVRVVAAPRAPLPPARSAQPPSFAALLTGHWEIVARIEAANRVHLIAHERAVALDHGFAARQARDARAALGLATRGVANKVIALELEVSQSTVTRMIGRALEALRLADVREAMTLARTEPALTEEREPGRCTWVIEGARRRDWKDLTAAECDIVERIIRHASRAEIARARGTSLFTVNSQLATIFAKLRVSSKRELLQVAAGR